MATPPAAPRPPGPRVPPALIGVGVLLAALGFGLPRLTPDAAPTVAAVEPAPQPAAATKPALPTPIAPVDGPALGASLARLAGSLAVVCGLCVAAARVAARRTAAGPDGAMEVLASLPIAGRSSVYLVKAGERRLLIGMDGGGVKALVELPGPAPEEVAGTVVVGPVAVAAPVAAPTPDEIAELITRLRATATR